MCNPRLVVHSHGQVPTGPEVFREAGYYTVHSGKWHLGGMREEQRRDRVDRDHCARPSPNQVQYSPTYCTTVSYLTFFIIAPPSWVVTYVCQ